MVRLERMAMAAQHGHLRQRAAAAAAAEEIALLNGPIGGNREAENSPDRNSSADCGSSRQGPALHREARRKEAQLTLAKNVETLTMYAAELTRFRMTRDCMTSNEGMGVEEHMTVGAATAVERGAAEKVNQASPMDVTLTMGTETIDGEARKMATNVDGVALARTMKMERTPPGCILALTSLRPTRPKCA